MDEIPNAVPNVEIPPFHIASPSLKIFSFFGFAVNLGESLPFPELGAIRIVPCAMSSPFLLFLLQSARSFPTFLLF